MEREPFYFGIIGLARAVFAVQGLKFTVTGEENVPATGGAVIAINHTGYMDFTYAGLPFRSQKRYVRYMAKSEIFDNKIAGPLMRGMKHIPVDRIDGSESYRMAIEYLKMGRLVGVFPESTISRSFELKDIRTGAVRMAQEANVPIIPVIMVGSQRVWTKGYPRHLGRTRTPIHIDVMPPWYPKGDPEEETAVLHDMMEKDLHKVWDEYAAAHGPLPQGAYWVPARLGGGAPTLEEAQKEDTAVAEERHRVRQLRDDLNELSSSVVETTKLMVAKSTDAINRGTDAVKAMSVSAKDSVVESANQLVDKVTPTKASKAGEEKGSNEKPGLTPSTAEATTPADATPESSTDAASPADATSPTPESITPPTTGSAPAGRDKTDPQEVVSTLRSTFDSLYAEVVDGTKEGASKIVDARDSLKASYSELLTSVQQRVVTMTDSAKDKEWPSMDQALTSLIGQAKQVRDGIPARVKSRLPEDVKAVCTDVDGTIMVNKNVSQATKDAFAALEKQGTPVILATGRPPELLNVVLDQLPISPLVVCANGAVVLDSATGETLHVDSFFEGAEELLREEISAAFPDAEIIVRRYQGAAVKIVVKADMPSADIADLLFDAVGQRAHMTYAGPYGSVEIAPIGVNKATGLQWLLNSRGIDPLSCIAFGDMPNDKEMLDLVGTPIVMGNAERDLIREATWVTQSCEDDGVADVLRYLVREEPEGSESAEGPEGSEKTGGATETK